MSEYTDVTPSKGGVSDELLSKADEVIHLLDDGRQRVVVTGPAGTGKTTLIREVIDGVDGSVCVVAYTGQAARMLQKRGIPATTIHRLVYVPAAQRAEEIAEVKASIAAIKGADPVSQGRRARLEDRLASLLEPGFVLNENSELRGKRLCIIDEVSMVPEMLGEDLQSFGVPVLAVGDPYQLGPVEGEPCFDLTDPDVALTTIFRQEEGSGIIDLATTIRTQRRADEYAASSGPDIYARQRKKMNNDDIKKWMTRVDQIICSTNDVRRSVNRRMLGYRGVDITKHRYPQGTDGEKLICLRNNYDLDIFNGQPLRLRDVDHGDKDSKFFTAEVLADDGADGFVSRGRATIYKGWFDFTASFTRNEEAKKRASIDLSNSPPTLQRGGPVVECDWGYCITTHKAQGSEWDKVLFISERWPNDRTERARMHYTAITRARQKIAIIDNWSVR
jgi:exodeoxyribonuclease-5